MDINDQTSITPRKPYTTKIKLYISTRKSYRSFLIHLTHFSITTATILCVVGGIYVLSNNEYLHRKGHILLDIGVGLFVGNLATLVLLTIWSGKDSHKLPHAERLIYFSVLAAVPFLAVRTVWSVLAVYTSLSGFSFWDPKPWILFSLSTLMEFMVAVMYCVVGIFIKR